MTRKLNAPLTSIRFFAAMHVVGLHFVVGRLQGAPKPVQEFLLRGDYGVTLFFVLSGFILAYNYMPDAARGNLNLPKYYGARFARVYPVYFLSHIAALPGVIYALAHRIELQAMAALLARQSLLRMAMLQSWFPRLYYEVHWNTVAWSVSVEAFFYLMYPSLAARIGRLNARASYLGVFVCLTVLFAIRYAYYFLNPDHLRPNEVPIEQFWNAVVSFNPIALLPQFLIGLFAGKIYLDRVNAQGDTRPRRDNGAVAVVAVCIVVLLAGVVTDREYIVRTVAAGLFAVFIYCVAMSEGITRKILSWAPLVVLGEASYSMYLIQRPLAEYLAMLIRRLNIDQDLVFVPILLLVLPLVSLMVWKYVETPLRVKVKRWIDLKASAQASPIAD